MIPLWIVCLAAIPLIVLAAMTYGALVASSRASEREERQRMQELNQETHDETPSV